MTMRLALTFITAAVVVAPGLASAQSIDVFAASGVVTEPPGIGGAVFQRTSTAGTLGGFAGVRISAGNNLFVRPEFELSKSGEYLRMGGWWRWERFGEGEFVN